MESKTAASWRRSSATIFSLQKPWRSGMIAGPRFTYEFLDEHPALLVSLMGGRSCGGIRNGNQTRRAHLRDAPGKIRARQKRQRIASAKPARARRPVPG